MYKSNVLIISNRKEQSVKYKKLIEALNQNVVFTADLSYALTIIQEQEIEFIIISDTIKEKLSDFVEKIRILTYNFRPIIIAVSKSSDSIDRIEALESGADDFLGEEISKQEFQTRFKAHLRRYLESSINPTSRILDKKFTLKALKRSLKSEDTSYLFIKIENIETYKNIHGEIAAQKVLQTLSAIINSTLAKNDFIGHISEFELLLITSNLLAEKLAQFLTFAFDNILNKFYSNDEFENDFMMKSSENSDELKEGLIKLSIAVLEQNENLKTIEITLNKLAELIKLCKDSKKSNYVIERIKLEGATNSVKEKNRVLVLEPDIALSYLIKNVCELNNLKVTLAKNIVEFKEMYLSFEPNVVVLDWGNKFDTISLNLAKEISKDDIKLIFTSAYLNKKEILKSGADLYIPKPYEIEDMVTYIKRFLA